MENNGENFSREGVVEIVVMIVVIVMIVAEEVVSSRRKDIRKFEV
jgi:hypothetical protein